MIQSRRIVLVTGAARGIGYAVAEAFAKNGDQPLIVDINGADAESSALQLANSYECEAVSYAVDVSDDESVKQLVEKVIARFGRLDVVVNNAGLQHVDAIENFPVEKWDQLIGVMLKGPFLLTKYSVPPMKARKYGKIINISSVHGRTASPYKAAYVSAKHGLVGLTKTVALEVANDGITVNAVMPGTVHTTLIENQLQKLAESDGTSREEALNKHLLAKQALKRFVDPSEVAATCVFLASAGADSITGETIGVSGGWL